MIGVSDKEQEMYERIQLEAENRLQDLFAEKNNLDCMYPKKMDLKEVTLCFHKK